MARERRLSEQRTIVDEEIERFISIAERVSQGEPKYELRGRLRALLSLLIREVNNLDQKIIKLE